MLKFCPLFLQYRFGTLPVFPSTDDIYVIVFTLYTLNPLCRLAPDTEVADNLLGQRSLGTPRGKRDKLMENRMIFYYFCVDVEQRCGVY